MSKLIAAAAAFIAMIGAARAEGPVWTMQDWPADLEQIPCSAWAKTADGTWVLKTGSIKLGSETMEHVGIKGDAAAHLLDRECGEKKK